MVTSYKLICPGTVEEKVLGLQEEKRALLAGVFEASDAAAQKLSLADLKGLLERADGDPPRGRYERLRRRYLIRWGWSASLPRRRRKSSM